MQKRRRQDNLKKPDKPMIHGLLANIDGPEREKPTVMPEPVEAAPSPVDKLLDKVAETCGDETRRCKAIDALGRYVAGQRPGWRQAVDTMVDWLGGRRDESDTASAFFATFRFHNPPPEVSDYMRESLLAAEDDDEHSYRQFAASTLASFLSPKTGDSVAMFKESMKSGDFQKRASLISHIAEKTLGKLRGGQGEQAEATIVEVIPDFLRIIAEDFGQMWTNHMMRMDKGAVAGCLIDWVKQAPDLTLPQIIRASTKKEGDMGEPDPELGQAGLTVLTGYLPTRIHNMPELLVKHAVIDGAPNTIVSNALTHFGEKSVKPILEQAAKSNDITELIVLGATLGDIGPETVDAILERFPGDDVGSFAKVMALLSPMVEAVGRGAGDTEAGKKLSALEGKLRGSTRLAGILMHAESSGNPPLMSSARMFRRYLQDTM